MKSDISRRQVAYWHLKYKTEHAYDMENMTNLGLLTVEELSSRVLKDIYPLDEVSSAASQCASQNLLDVYYLVKCEKCNHESHIIETNNDTIETLISIINNGAVCSNCRSSVSLTHESVDVRFAIPTRYLGEDGEIAKQKSFFKRLIEWLKPKMK